MNIALYGGSFDPIHSGHIAVARAAAARFHLKQIHFVVTALSPFKVGEKMTPFSHRYAMAALAISGEKNFIPSLLEAPAQDGNSPQPNFAIETVRVFKRTLKKTDQLFYIIGVDAFAELQRWRDPEALLAEVQFIVASRPGYSMADLAKALPVAMRPNDAILRASAKQKLQGSIVLPGVTIHLLDGVKEPAASRDVRAAIRSGKSVDRLLSGAVAEYIKKTGLYRAPEPPASPGKPVRATGMVEKKRAPSKPAKVLEFNPTGNREKR